MALAPITESGDMALRRVPPSYPPPQAAPYGPEEAYPEFGGRLLPEPCPGAPNNPIFAAVRGLLRDLGLDAGRFGSAEWNPLGALVPGGSRILVKPNWVLHRNQRPGGGMDCMVTHPAVLRAVLEYVFLAKPREVVLGDAPLQGCDFAALQGYGGLPEVLESFARRGLKIEVRDFRRTVLEQGTEGARAVSENVRDEFNYVLARLGANSFLEPISKDWRRFRVTMYDPRLMARHHRPGQHDFLLAREVMDADLVVNCPKLKTHKKAGITCCLKNLIGINGNKEYLPHHRKGALEARRGGDSHGTQWWLVDALESALDLINRHRDWPRTYAFAERWIYRIEDHVVRRRDPAAQMEGNWHGNDTIWRTCLDLNRALLYGDVDGTLRDTPQRQELSIVDGVVAGQGEGPLEPFALPTGALFAARNPAAGDFLAARLLGFSPAKIPIVSHSCDAIANPICTLGAEALAQAAERLVADAGDAFPPAVPPMGWA